MEERSILFGKSLRPLHKIEKMKRLIITGSLIAIVVLFSSCGSSELQKDTEQIADAMLLLLERKKVIAEGAGAAPLAALLGGSVPVEPQSTVVLVISGGNVDATILERIIRRGQIQQGRIMCISTVLKDMPGSLASFLTEIARMGGNILQIHHVQGGRNLPVLTVHVDLEIETRGIDHKREIIELLDELYAQI